MGSRLEVAEYLTGKEADVNVQDKDSKTPLHFASYHGNGNLVRLLLDKGADVDLQDDGSRTALYTALHLNNRYYGKSCAKLLIAHKIKLQGSNAEKPEYLLKNLNTDLKRRMSEYWDECLDEEIPKSLDNVDVASLNELVREATCIII